MTGTDLLGVGGLVLAAGASSRMGRPKQLVEFEGSTLIRRAATSMAASSCHPKVVVLGSGADRSREELTGIDISICVNEDWPTGMSSSIRAGISKLLDIDPDLDAAIITLCDQPFIATDIIDNLAAEYRRIRPQVIASEYNGVTGVPALFSRDMFDSILKLDGDHGARRLIRLAGEDVTRIQVPLAAIDIDSPNDLASLENLK